MLLEEFDPARNAVIEPEMVAKKIDGFPEVSVSCFSKSLFDSVLGVLTRKRSASSALPSDETRSTR